VTKFFYNNSERFKFLNICLKNQLRIDDLNSCIDYPRDIFFSKRFINNSKIKNLHKNLIITKS